LNVTSSHTTVEYPFFPKCRAKEQGRPGKKRDRSNLSMCTGRRNGTRDGMGDTKLLANFGYFMTAKFWRGEEKKKQGPKTRNQQGMRGGARVSKRWPRRGKGKRTEIFDGSA